MLNLTTLCFSNELPEIGDLISENHLRKAFSRIYNSVNPQFLDKGPQGQQATGRDILKSILANSIEVELRVRIEGIDRLEAMDIIYEKTDKLTADPVWIAPVNPNAGVPGSRSRSSRHKATDEPAVLLLGDGSTYEIN